MLAVTPLRNSTTKDHDPHHHHESQGGEMESFSIGVDLAGDDFSDFCHGNSLLDSIDFDDLFLGIHDGDVLPDLEMDPELLAEFSAASTGEDSDIVNTPVDKLSGDVGESDYPKKEAALDGDKSSGFNTNSGSPSSTQSEEVVSEMDASVVVNPTRAANDGKGRKPSSTAQSKNNPQGKRKVKVDWTPELHRRFVQAVEQLGVDKAVPSRILELMGIDCLTRHNIASHLQKYRSHRKHLLAREAEAASWSQRRQIYGGAAAVAAAGGGAKRNGNPWLAPAAPATLGFPPAAPVMPHFRPLHVWGHPTMDQSMVNMWQKHHHPPPATTAPVGPPPAWPPAALPHHHLPPEGSYWHPSHQRVPNALTPGAPCFPQPLPPARFGAPPVPGILPHAMHKPNPVFGHPTAPSSVPHPPFDFHPSKESIDAAIGDVLSKPWLPLPLGLKPPSLDGVMGELQRQGVPKFPPPCA